MTLIFGVRSLLCTFSPMVSENCVPVKVALVEVWSISGD